jgi:hypothetical protein
MPPGQLGAAIHGCGRVNMSGQANPLEAALLATAKSQTSASLPQRTRIMDPLPFPCKRAFSSDRGKGP